MMNRWKQVSAAAAVLGAGMLTSAAMAPAMQPGRWETVSRTVDFEMALPAGIPAGMAEQMKTRMLSQSYRGEQCITREQIERGPEAMMSGTNGECEYTRFQMEDGTLDAAARCESMGTVMNMEMSGTYTATTYESRMTMTGTGPAGDMRVVSEMNGRRLGDCQ